MRIFILTYTNSLENKEGFALLKARDYMEARRILLSKIKDNIFITGSEITEYINHSSDAQLLYKFTEGNKNEF